METREIKRKIIKELHNQGSDFEGSLITIGILNKANEEQLQKMLDYMISIREVHTPIMEVWWKAKEIMGRGKNSLKNKVEQNDF